MRYPVRALFFLLTLTASVPAAEGPSLKDAPTIGLSRVLQSLGEYDKALEVIDAVLKDDAKNADLLARRADLLYLRGDWDGALKAAEDALAQKDEQFLARWVRARILFDRADFEKADAEFRWFVRTY